MISLNIYRFYRYACMLIALLFICGCPRIWYFTITDINDPSHPHFCFGSRECDDKGVSFHALSIDEVTDEGELLKCVWFVVRNKNETIKKMVYGVSPPGYTEGKKAEPLEMNKWYTVMGLYYFRIVQDSGKAKVEIYERARFYTKIVRDK